MMCFPFQSDRVLDFDCLLIFILHIIPDFFSQILLGFVPFSPLFSNPTISAWQLHITFMTISTQPPSSCSFFHIALKSWSFPHEQFRDHSHWLCYPRGTSGPLVQGPSISLQCWVGLIPRVVLSSQEQWQVALSSKSSGGGLKPSTWAAPGAPAVLTEGLLGHLIYTWILVSGLQGYKEQQPKVQSK